MQVIDLRKYRAATSPLYIGIPQPMYVCYNSEEIKQFNRKKIIAGLEDLLKLTTPYKDNDVHQFKDIWIRTQEKFVPEAWTDDGQIIFKLVNGKVVPTDGVYVQLLAFQIMGNWILLATSSGLYKASIHHWRVSGAIQNQFNHLPAYHRTTGEGKISAGQRHLRRKRANINDLRYVHYLINHSSPAFGNPDLASKMAYPANISKVTRKMIINSPRILQLLIKEIKMLYPDIADELKELVPVKKVGEHMNAMLDKSIEKGTTEDQIKALDVVLRNIYSEPEVVTDALNPANPTLVGEGIAEDYLVTEPKSDPPKEMATSKVPELPPEKLNKLREDYNVLTEDDGAPLQRIKIAEDLE